MTCKDCIHYKVCCQKLLHVVTGMDFVYRYKYNHIERVCKDFKDRSRFVELPCKFGDVIFCTTMGKIYQGVVGKIELGDEGFDITTVDGYCFDSSICYHTQKEAEQALKERKANENS